MNKISRHQAPGETSSKNPPPLLQSGEATGLINRWRDPSISRPPADRWVEVFAPGNPAVVFYGRFRPAFLFFRARWDRLDGLRGQAVKGTLWRMLSATQQREAEQFMIDSFNERAW